MIGIEESAKCHQRIVEAELIESRYVCVHAVSHKRCSDDAVSVAEHSQQRQSIACFCFCGILEIECCGILVLSAGCCAL